MLRICTFSGLPGGMWQIVTVSFAANAEVVNQLKPSSNRAGVKNVARGRVWMARFSSVGQACTALGFRSAIRYLPRCRVKQLLVRLTL